MKLHYVRCTLVLVLWAAPVWAGSPPTPVTAVLMPEGQYSSIAIGEMGREASRILKQTGVRLRWHLGSEQVPSGLLVVVRLLGRCEMGGPSAEMKSRTLGWADEVDGEILPFSELACDNIRGFIQATLLPRSLPANVMLGRAMGRVLAHELYHIVADTAQHGRNGVAEAEFSPRELISGRLELQPSDVEAIRDGLRQARR